MGVVFACYLHHSDCRIIGFVGYFNMGRVMLKKFAGLVLLECIIFAICYVTAFLCGVPCFFMVALKTTFIINVAIVLALLFVIAVYMIVEG